MGCGLSCRHPHNNLVRHVKKEQKLILVADDDPVYRDVAKEALETAGHSVITADDGGEAIKALLSTRFDTAIVDLTMPVASGLTVIENARREGSNIHTPIIVITGHDDSTAVVSAYKAGATSFLTKPLNWVLFTPHVEFVLRSGQIETELREAMAAAAFLGDLKSQMMSALARQFQMPIKTIFGFSELIRQEAYGTLEPPAYRDMAHDMGEAARTLNAAFLQLMDFGKNLTENLTVKAETVPLRELVTGSIKALQPKAERRGVVLKTNLQISPDTSVQGDRALLSQAIRSLIDNAIRLSPRGAEVEINACISDDGSFRIWTMDHGPPVPADLLAEVNGRTANRPSMAAQSESRDVGMKIAKILAEAHQGKLDVRSDPDGGNLIKIELPKERVNVQVNVQKAAAKPTAVPTASMNRLVAISEALANDPRVRMGQQAERLDAQHSLSHVQSNSLPSAQPLSKFNLRGTGQ